jgi:hypothetical protein
MKRTIERWRDCDPRMMAFEQSDAAKFYAFQDAKADILELHGQIGEETMGEPERFAPYLLLVREVSNGLNWTAWAIGVYDGEGWMIQRNAPDYGRHGSFFDFRALDTSRLSVISWRRLVTPSE